MHMNCKRPELCVSLLLAAMGSWSKFQPIPHQAAFCFVFSIGLSYESAYFTEARDCYAGARDILVETRDASHPRLRIVSKNLANSGRHSLDFEVSFEPLRAMQLPKGMVGVVLFCFWIVWFVAAGAAWCFCECS